MIGLVVMPPGPVQASNDQSPGSCFILQVDNFAPAVFVQEVAAATVMHYSNVSACIVSNAVLPDIVYLTDEQVIMKLPDVYLNYNYRLCQFKLEANRRPPNSHSKKIKTQNSIAAPGSIEIRADTQKG